MRELTVPVSKIKNDRELEKIIKKYSLSLTPFEVRKIRKILGRDPTIVELWIFNVEWSEHCSYKSSKTTLKKFLHTTGPNVIQGIEEDAGIIYLTTINGERYGVVIAHESHNHPSQVLPNEGAATGIGGIVRDVDCMGARVVGVADPLRFGDPYGKYKNRTRWIISGVVDGIWQYANALGVPNLGGDVVFSSSFDDNCLVNVVAIGIIKEDEIIHSRVPEEAKYEDYDVILIGKPTDDSGFGGSAFASEILDETQERRGAVQVPDPFLKNVLLLGKANREVFEKAKKMGIKIGFKDLGGAGLACASSEIGAAGGFGIEIDLDKVHTAIPNLLPEVICCAETQERYILVCPKRFTKEVLKIYNKKWALPEIYEGARASVIGKVRRDGRYVIKYKGKELKEQIVCDAPIQEIARGIIYHRKFKKREWKEEEPEFSMPSNLNKILLKILSSCNIASKEYIYRFYDTEVQGNAVIRPGEADASLIAPIPGNPVGVALSCDGNPFYGRISPYWGGATAVAEAMRNVAAIGAIPSGLTDCLNFGNPEKEEAFWEFRESVRGLSDAAKKLYLKGYENTPVPIVSGNVSFYNESAKGYAIDPSPIICCVGIIQDYSKAITMGLKEEGNFLYLAGERYEELGGSEYYRTILKVNGKNVPKVRWEKERGMIYAVTDAIERGYLKSCHDISNGGLVVSVCEMVMSAYKEFLSAEIEIENIEKKNLRTDKKLFSESSGFIMEVRPTKDVEKVKEIFKRYNLKIYYLGKVIKSPYFTVLENSKKIINLKVEKMKKIWKNALAEAIR